MLNAHLKASYAEERDENEKRKSNPCLIQFACARESDRGIVYK